MVFNLESTVSNDELREIFGVYGEIREVMGLFYYSFAYVKNRVKSKNFVLLFADSRDTTQA